MNKTQIAKELWSKHCMEKQAHFRCGMDTENLVHSLPRVIEAIVNALPDEPTSGATQTPKGTRIEHHWIGPEDGRKLRIMKAMEDKLGEFPQSVFRKEGVEWQWKQAACCEYWLLLFVNSPEPLWEGEVEISNLDGKVRNDGSYSGQWRRIKVREVRATI